MGADRPLQGPTGVVSPTPEEPHQLVDLAFDAMFTRSFSDRTITSWNRGAEHLYGWTRAEALGKEPGELLCSRYPVPLEEIEEKLKTTGEWEGEIIQCHKSGRLINAQCRWGLQTDSAGEPLAILEINSDISAQQRTAERLRQSEQRYSLLVSAIKEYAIFMLDPDGIVTSWNEGAQRIKGYRADEIIGTHFSIFYTPEDRAAKKPSRALHKAEREGQFAGEGWRVRKDGSRFWASVLITALRDDTGKLQGFAKVTRDASDKHQEEERLRQHARDIAELDRAKTQFMDLVAHELRAPLTLIRGYNSLLEQGKLEPEQIVQIAVTLEGKLQQMSLLIDQVLDVSRLENDRLELELETLDLHALADDEINRVRSLIGGGRRITMAGRTGLALVSADRTRIGAIISNLLDNAIKYSPSGGDVEVEVGRADSGAFVAVRDKGLGIAPEHLSLLFQRYTRLPTEENKRIRGTGLALYLCQEIARRHGGEIRVKSQPAKGSEFTLNLPALDREP